MTTNPLKPSGPTEDRLGAMVMEALRGRPTGQHRPVPPPAHPAFAGALVTLVLLGLAGLAGLPFFIS